jgi:glycine dehydrogenase
VVGGSAALDAEWTRRYTREEAVFPARVSRTARSWRPIGRVDNACGDQHLVCIFAAQDEHRDEAA